MFVFFHFPKQTHLGPTVFSYNKFGLFRDTSSQFTWKIRVLAMQFCTRALLGRCGFCLVFWLARGHTRVFSEGDSTIVFVFPVRLFCLYFVGAFFMVSFQLWYEDISSKSLNRSVDRYKRDTVYEAVLKWSVDRILRVLPGTSWGVVRGSYECGEDNFNSWLFPSFLLYVCS